MFVGVLFIGGFDCVLVFCLVGFCLDYLIVIGVVGISCSVALAGCCLVK